MHEVKLCTCRAALVLNLPSSTSAGDMVHLYAMFHVHSMDLGCTDFKAVFSSLIAGRWVRPQTQ